MLDIERILHVQPFEDPSLTVCVLCWRLIWDQRIAWTACGCCGRWSVNRILAEYRFCWASSRPAYRSCLKDADSIYSLLVLSVQYVPAQLSLMKVDCRTINHCCASDNMTTHVGRRKTSGDFSMHENATNGRQLIANWFCKKKGEPLWFDGLICWTHHPCEFWQSSECDDHFNQRSVGW